jgi:hypothetical protein
MYPLFLTFDYEIFFGNDSGTLEKCIFDPIDALTPLLDEVGAKATFFVDILHYYRLNELRQYHSALDQQAKDFKIHVQHLLSLGHDIQLHLHPHWLDAVYLEKENRWRFSYEHYRLHDLEDSNGGIDTIGGNVKFGKELLSDICSEVDSEHEIMAFRAGGYCLEPFSYIKNALEVNGIHIDSSVARNCVVKIGMGFEQDFSKTPNIPYWRFENKVLEPQSNGPFCEVPVTAIRIPTLLKIMYILKRKRLGLNWQRYGNGLSMDHSHGKRGIDILRRIFTPFDDMLLTSERSVDELNYILKRHVHLMKANGPAVLMGHSKALSRASLHQLGKFLRAHDFEYLTFRSFSKLINI